jgi:hypothetical protein
MLSADLVIVLIYNTKLCTDNNNNNNNCFLFLMKFK